MQIQLYFVLPIEEFCFAEIFVPFPKIPIKILQIIKNMFFGICGLIFKKSNFFIVFGLVKNWYLIFIPVYFSHSILLVLSFICIQVFWPILSLLQIYLSTYLSIYLSIYLYFKALCPKPTLLVCQDMSDLTVIQPLLVFLPNLSPMLEIYWFFIQ